MGEFRMPSLGADMEDGTLLEWLVAPGDRVARGDLVAVVDTDKAAIEVESFAAGTVKELLVPPGTRVPVGTVLATLADDADLAGQAPAPPPATPAAAPAATPAAIPAAAPARLPRQAAPVRPGAAPPVRRLAERLGVDLTHVRGTGRAGAVTRVDVERATRARTTPARPPVTPYARRLARELGIDLDAVRPRGQDRVVRAADVRAAAPAGAAPDVVPPPDATGPPPGAPPHDRARAMRAAIARSTTRSAREIPHYYLTSTIDLAAATSWLQRRNRDRAVSERLVPAALLLKATATAAHRHRDLNGLWTDGAFHPSPSVHLGVAVALRGGGLVAPAVHDAQTLDLDDLMARLRDLVSRARGGRLRRTELTDPTLTVTSLGDRGVEAVHGVIQSPQVALVGFGTVLDRPWAVDGMLAVRPTVTATLAADHRVSDGYTGARFLVTIGTLLQRPEDL